MKLQSQSTKLRLGAALSLLFASWCGWTLWTASQTGLIASRGRNLTTLADEPLGFWFLTVAYTFGLIAFSILALVCWKGASGERRADQLMALRDIPLDRAVRAQQDPEA